MLCFVPSAGCVHYHVSKSSAVTSRNSWPAGKLWYGSLRARTRFAQGSLVMNGTPGEPGVGPNGYESGTDASGGYAADQDYPSDSYRRSPTEAVRSAVFDKVKIGQTKLKLLQLAASTGRGELASIAQRNLVEDLVMQLESMSPTLSPLESPDIDGVWQLVYCSKPLYKINPFYLPAATPLGDLGVITQTISMDLGELVNEAEVHSFPAVNGTIVSIARILPVNETRMELQLDRVTLRAKDIAGRFDLGGLKFDVPVERIYERLQRGQSGRAFLDISFLDEDMRICRGRERTIYVFTKMPK